MLARLRCAVVWTATVCVAFSATAAAQEVPAKPLSALELADGDTVVFLGDSITHQCLYTQYVEDFFFTRYPGKQVRFHNAGVGGAKAWDALQRLEKDVAAYKPKYVTVLLGMNDGSYQPFNQAIFDTYQQDMTQVVERITATGAVPVLMTPTMYDARAVEIRGQKADATRDLYNSVLAYYGEWLRRVAMKNGHGFVDMHSLLNNLTLQERKSDPKFTMIPDAVHPAAPGQLVMAYAMIDQLGLRKPLSNIHIERGATGKPVFRAVGGELTDLKMTDEGLEFTWTADALPWVVPQEAQAAAELLRLGHRASREALAVHDLPAGNYQLTIDDEPIGVFSAQQLARHIELQDNPRTPQHLQAAQVAELNKQRNAGPVRSLRNEWSVFQGYARMKRQLETSEDEKLKEQFAKLGERVATMDERIRELEAASEEFLTKIREAARPQPRHYQIDKVESAEATGLVSFQGQPLSGATVRFVGKDLPAIGTARTNKAGRFVIRSNGLVGITPGVYAVTIEQETVPEKYATDKSGLTVEVKSGQNELNFDLQ